MFFIDLILMLVAVPLVLRGMRYHISRIGMLTHDMLWMMTGMDGLLEPLPIMYVTAGVASANKIHVVSFIRSSEVIASINDLDLMSLQMVGLAALPPVIMTTIQTAFSALKIQMPTHLGKVLF